MPSQTEGVVATPDPQRFATESSGSPRIEIRSESTEEGVTTLDISFGDEQAGQTDAYLVAPTPELGVSPGPGIIWFHWYEVGSETANRTEFLTDARALARRGAVSLLVQGTFPWEEPPSSIAHDVPAIEDEVRMLRRGVDLLAARDDVDPERIAAVGHDFGAMYASVLFGADPRVKALVMMAPTARWADWYVRYWPISDADDAYQAALAPLDPVTWLPAADGRPILLQFADDDRFIPRDVADAIATAAGEEAETRHYPAEHDLAEPDVEADRTAWLARELRLPEGLRS